MRTRRKPSQAALMALAMLFVVAVAAMTVVRVLAPEHDLVITNALIYDGTGGPPYNGVVAVDGQHVARIWRGQPWMRPRARLRLDISGDALVPGFIDSHSHADLSIGEGNSPVRADNFLYQGVTTVIVGNCGRAPIPIRELSSLISRRGSNVNVASLAGLNSIRARVMGESAAAASAEHTAALVSLVRGEMEAGAVGVSTGYAYGPGRFASRQEVLAQLRAAGAYGGVHATHMRDEGARILASAEEVVRVSADARVPLLVSHLKITGPANCRLYSALMDKLRGPSARAVVYFDQYPYDASSTSLELLLPDWFLAGGERGEGRLLASQPDRLKRAITDYLQREAFADLRFARVASYAPRREWQGLTIDEIDRRFFGHAKSTLATQLDVVLEMLRHGGAQMIYRNICEDVMISIPRDARCMIGSDSAIRFNDGTTIPHPRGLGTFPRMISEYVRRRRLMPLEEAIRRMTDLPARFFGLEARGRIAPGYYADLVVLDPLRIADRAASNQPFARPDGIKYVFVNGTCALETRRRGWRGTETDAATTEATAGAFLKREAALHRAYTGLADSHPIRPLVPETRLAKAMSRLFGHDRAQQ